MFSHMWSILIVALTSYACIVLGEKEEEPTTTSSTANSSIATTTSSKGSSILTSNYSQIYISLFIDI